MAILPIVLLNFNAFLRNNKPTLTWKTATEFNNDFFAIERSPDNMVFSEIGRVAGKGSTNRIQDYQYIDEYPVTGINYYRLRQVDFDGKVEYHKVTSITTSNQNKIRISPTSATNEITIFFFKKQSNRKLLYLCLTLMEKIGKPLYFLMPALKKY